MKSAISPLEAARARLEESTPGSQIDLDLIAAAGELMKAAEEPTKVSIADMLRCLDFPGVVAEIGARCLYVRTGRDGVGWRPAGVDGLPFSTSKEDWLQFLREKNLIGK